MFAKVIFILCVQALFIQCAISQCTSRAVLDASGFADPYGLVGPAIAPLPYDGFAGAFGYDKFTGPLAYDGLAGWGDKGISCGIYKPSIDITPTSSGGLVVTSSSPVAPTGISVISDNVYEGILAVAGEVPFVGTSGLEGIVPTAGAGAVKHACGNGVNIMVSEPGYGGYGLDAFAPAIVPAFASEFIPEIAPAFASTAYTGCGCGYLY